jgi:hypothetical protein
MPDANMTSEWLVLFSIGVAVCLAIGVTVRFAKSLRLGNEPLRVKVGRYVKNLLDALWGAG